MKRKRPGGESEGNEGRNESLSMEDSIVLIERSKAFLKRYESAFRQYKSALVDMCGHALIIRCQNYWFKKFI